MNSNLIIVSPLSCEPLSEGLYFRYLTLVAKTQLQYSILLETEKKAIDFYWKYLKQHGWFDFVDDFITENQEEGLRLDTGFNYSNTIITKGIRCENTLALVRDITQVKGGEP
jgi:hypothetical protein